MDDAVLLDRWNGGDVAAGEQMFERHFDSLYRFFRSKAPDECEELVQRTMMACLEKRDRLSEVASFRAFLFGVARFELLRLFRRRDRRAREVDIENASVHDLLPSPSRVVAKKKEHRVLLEALRRIPVDLQIVIELHFWEELTTAEIADAVGIPAGTVKSRLRRAREQLEAAVTRIAVEPDVLQSTVAGLEGWAADVKDLLAEGR